MNDELKTALRNALKATDAKPHYFALVVKGSDGALIVDKRKPAPKAVEAAKKQLAASTVLRGVCFGADGTMVFQTVRPPGGNMAAVVKKVAQTQAGLTIKPEFRVGAADDGEDEEEQGQEVPEAPPVKGTAVASGGGAAKTAYETLLARVQPELRAAQNAHLAAAAKAAVLLQFAADKAKANDHAAAQQAAQNAQALLQKATAEMAVAMEAWKTRRATAVASLKSMAGKIAGAKHPSSARAIMEIQSVMKNLTAEPATFQQVSELQTWLGKDDVVNDVCELVEDIRTPLHAALADLHGRLAP